MSIHTFDWQTGEETETYKGCVLELGQRDTYDTDWIKYAVVWDNNDGFAGTIKHVQYWHSHPGQHHALNNHAEIDATPDVLAYAAAFKAARAAKAQAAAEAAEATTVRVGKTVKVVRGRKVPKGTVSKVVWMGEDRYDYGYRVGLMVDGERVYTNAANVVVLQESEVND